MTGGWFWLVASFAATLFAVYPRETASDVVGHLVRNAVSYGVPVILWSLAWRILGALLRAAGPAPAPSWIFRCGGWTVATLGAGVLLALQAGDDPRFLRDLDAWYEALLFMAGVGLGWWLVLDLGRAVLARLAGWPAPPVLSVATLAFLAGLGAIAWTVHAHLEGMLTEPPFEVGIVFLALALGAGAVLTVAVELPRALLAHRRREGGDRTLSTARARLAGQLRLRTGEPAPASPVHRVARSEHGRIQTPPTVVRRQ